LFLQNVYTRFGENENWTIDGKKMRLGNVLLLLAVLG
jgi:hypothetical protein